MSFVKITDPAKRDSIVKESLELRSAIKQNSLSQKLGDIGLQRDLSKIFKPITESQSTITKEIGALKDSTSSTLQALPASISSQLKALTLPNYSSIQAEPDEFEDAVEQHRLIELGEIATKYLKSAMNKQSTDRTFGLYENDDKFFIGNEEVTIAGDDIIVGTTKYRGTSGLWELIMSKNPDDKLYNSEDKQNYKNILLETNAIINPATNRVRSSGGDKYKNIIKPIYDEYKNKKGKGLMLPSDPNVLVDMLSLRLASYKAGNTGLRNEIVDICDELKRQNVLTDERYKNLMLTL